ncbi:hypothetical protein ACFX2K_031875 [Malus domestica]
MIFCPNPSLGNFDYAEKVFRFIKDPCFFVYDVMIKAFAKRSSFRSAVELFRRLREEGLCPYNFTYPFVLKPLDAWERFVKVKRCLMKYPRETGFVGTWNVTISRYVRCRRFEEALDMFRRMSCESNEKPDEATFGMKPDDFTFIIVLTDCVHRGLVDEGCEFFNSNRKIYVIERGPKKSKYDANNLVPQENMDICKAYNN